MKPYLKSVDSTNFNEHVLKENLPVIVHFSTSWCKKCKMNTPYIEYLAKKFDSKAKFVNINADEEWDIAARYGVRNIPSIIIFKNGMPHFKSVGIKSKNALACDIEKILKK